MTYTIVVRHVDTFEVDGCGIGDAVKNALGLVRTYHTQDGDERKLGEQHVDITWKALDTTFLSIVLDEK